MPTQQITSAPGARSTGSPARTPSEYSSEPDTSQQRPDFRRYFGTHVFALLAILAVAVIYLAALVSMPPQGLTEHDTGAKYLQVRNLRLTPSGLDWSINYPARPLDPQLDFVPFHPKQHYVDSQGRIYLQWPVFLGVLTRIPWKVLGFWGLYVVPLLAGLGTLWAAYMLALAVGLPRRVAWLVVPLVGLATPISIYSLLFFEHTLAALLVTLSLLPPVLALATGNIKTRSIILSGLALAAAIYFRSELYVLAVVTGLGLLLLAWRDRRWRMTPVIWGGTLLLALLPLWGFYIFTEGSILPAHATPYFSGGDSTSKVELPPLRYIATAGWRVIPDFLFGPHDLPQAVSLPWWAEIAGMAGLGLCILPVLGRLIKTRLALYRPLRLGTTATGLLLIAVATVVGLASPDQYRNLHGFLLASPFVAMAAVYRPAGDESRAERHIGPGAWLLGITLLYVGLHVLIISALSGLGPVSRHEWGQRYILPAYPALAVLALLAAWRVWSRYASEGRWRVVAGACLALWGLLVAVGIGFNLRGYVALREERTEVVSWLDLARTLPDREPLVTNLWWLPLNLAADFYSRPIMLAGSDARLADWAGKMKARGVTAFGLMTTDRAELDGAWTRQVPGLSADGAPSGVNGIWLQKYNLK